MRNKPVAVIGASTGRLDDPNLEDQMHEVVVGLLAEAGAAIPERLAA